MAKSSPRWRLTPLMTLVLCLILCISVTPALGASEPRPSSVQSQGQAELICHTSDPKDCYPRIFEPTHEFQTVHDDQELPNGLYVRLNIWTGKKEAKINVPGEGDPALEGLPVDQAVVVVDPDQSQDQHSALRVPKDAPRYEPVGKVKEPKHEAEGFAGAMKMLRGGVASNGQAFDEALEGLEDLSHDIYYGLKIAEDPEAVKSLFCLMTSQAPSVDPRYTPRDQQAASILASALQNNPPALEQVTKDWAKLTATKCPGAETTLGEAIYRSFVPSRNADIASGAKQSAARAKAKVSVVNGLIKDAAVRRDFLANGGMGGLLEVLAPEGAEWAAAQRKAGQLALDNFLDEDMGAQLGQWPRGPKVSDEKCRAADAGTPEGCWDYHVARIMKANKGNKNHWSRDLNDRLAAARKRASASPGREEL
ncbi:C6 zinc finger domain protein [Purpureocillium lavendulum]|uniref:Nucleotide exchange factor SIL1 n=1 Tax=Purpureocillium lavendulum TaxID=1247861 RepID=A0AB34G498_9HYPO|nr:C6 zinc finger domain protein [Purpureocillium lavendulum]